MSDPPATSPPPAEQASDVNNDDNGVDFTAMLPLEVMVYLLEIGAFTHSQLAPLRLVNRAFCDAASDPSLYRVYTCRSLSTLNTLPPFVANGAFRLKCSGNGEIDIGTISRLMPNLTSLDVLHHGVANVDGSTLVLRELRLTVRIADLPSQLTTLECLDISHLAYVAPIASLPRLRRLGLPIFEGDPGDLMSTLASAPCAATLEALSLDMRYSKAVFSWRMELLSGLVNLREVELLSGARAIRSGDDIDAMASALADHPTLAVLDLKVPEVVTTAVLYRGLPPNLKVLGISSRSKDVFEALLALLPPNLLAFRFNFGVKCSAADVRALLSHCPQLYTLDVGFDGEAVEYLASGDVDRTLLLNHRIRNWTLYDALAAAGHRVGKLMIGVHWRIAGGIVFDGKAVAA